MRRSLLLLVCLAACGPASRGGTDPGAGPAPAPAPGEPGAPTTATGRGDAVLLRAIVPTPYAITRRDSLELSLPGGASQVQTFDRTAFVTVGVAEGPGSFRATIVLDSLRAGPNSVIPPDSVAQAEGTRWTATLTPQGELTGITADRAGTIVDQVGASLRFLFPTLPEDGARDQAAWSDTATVTYRADAFETTERAVTQYTAARDETGGRRMLRIEGAAEFERNGTGSQYGNQMEMTATGTRRLTYSLGMNGDVLGVEGTESGDMTITVPAVGQTVPVKQYGSVSISRLGPAPR